MLELGVAEAPGGPTRWLIQVSIIKALDIREPGKGGLISSDFVSRMAVISS
jgi:hypothetical protein